VEETWAGGGQQGGAREAAHSAQPTHLMNSTGSYRAKRSWGSLMEALICVCMCMCIVCVCVSVCVRARASACTYGRRAGDGAGTGPAEHHGTCYAHASARNKQHTQHTNIRTHAPPPTCDRQGLVSTTMGIFPSSLASSSAACDSGGSGLWW